MPAVPKLPVGVNDFITRLAVDPALKNIFYLMSNSRNPVCYKGIIHSITRPRQAIKIVEMRKLTAYNFITLNGYFEGPKKGDISWHKHGAEENEYAVEMLQSRNTLLFGRVTYEIMANYWPTPVAVKNDPLVAEGMNNADKIVFSRTLKKALWKNTTLMKENIEEEIKKMKYAPGGQGKDMTLLGSGSILTQFAEKGLIDEYQVMVDPVVLGSGTPIFKGMKQRPELELMMTRRFKSGAILLCYRLIKK